jgi:spermidine synthase
LPLHQLDLGTLRSIVRSFLSVYPHAWAMLANSSLETPVLGLVALRDSTRFDVDRARDRRSHWGLRTIESELGLDDEFAVLGSFIAGPTALARFSMNVAENTDDLPVVAYRAPRITYAADSSPRERLLALLGQLSIEPAELIVPPADPAWPRRLAAYWSARERFIASGRDVRPSPRVEEMLAQVQEPLLSVLRTSPDFRPAYDPLLAMAAALARSNAGAARALLAELSRIQPARTEASQLLAALASEVPASAASSR